MIPFTNLNPLIRDGKKFLFGKEAEKCLIEIFNNLCTIDFENLGTHFLFEPNPEITILPICSIRRGLFERVGNGVKCKQTNFIYTFAGFRELCSLLIISSDRLYIDTEPINNFGKCNTHFIDNVKYWRWDIVIDNISICENHLDNFIEGANICHILNQWPDGEYKLTINRRIFFLSENDRIKLVKRGFQAIMELINKGNHPKILLTFPNYSFIL